MKKDAKANAPQTAAQTPNEKLKDPNLSSTCAEELWVEIGIFEFFIGHLCSSLWQAQFKKWVSFFSRGGISGKS